MKSRKEYLFIDESGDPGDNGSLTYAVAGVHLNSDELMCVRDRLGAIASDYSVKEFKFKASPTSSSIRALREAKALGLHASAIWINKVCYLGPYFNDGDTWMLRKFLVCRLLEWHRRSHQWSSKLEVVVDRWKNTPANLPIDLEKYIKKTWKLTPVVECVSLVNSELILGVQLADLYAGMARHVVSYDAKKEVSDLARALMPELAEEQGRRNPFVSFWQPAPA